jgi:hypothetical protein
LIVSLPYTVSIKFQRGLTMRGRNEGEESVVRGKEVFVGIDVHKESRQVTVRAEGEEVFRGRISRCKRQIRAESGSSPKNGTVLPVVVG